jgi:hypothetical protein
MPDRMARCDPGWLLRLARRSDGGGGRKRRGDELPIRLRLLHRHDERRDGGGLYRYENLYASDSSVITISGIDFMVDGTPVPFGDLSALTGTLTGTLTSGDFIDNVFYQGGYAGTYTGIIRLVPEPSTAALLALGLVGIAAMRRQRAN